MGRSLVEVWHSQGVVRLRFPKKIWIIVIGLVRYALCTNKFIFYDHKSFLAPTWGG